MQKPRGGINGFTGPVEVLHLPRHGAPAPNPLARSAVGEKFVAPSCAYRRGSVAPGTTHETAGRSAELRARGKPMVQVLWLVKRSAFGAQLENFGVGWWLAVLRRNR